MRQSDYVTYAYRLIPRGKSCAAFIPCHIDGYQIPPPIGFPLAVLVIFSSILIVLRFLESVPSSLCDLHLSPRTLC